MTIVGGIDIHRAQLTYDYVDLATGEVHTGRVTPANRGQSAGLVETVRTGVDDVAFALEGCTGWRYVVEELVRAGVTAHVAEPAETAALRGKKSRAKTDRADARHLRQLLVDGRVPESWIPPAHVLDARVLVRLYKDLVDERTGWLQRVHATLFHHGVPAVGTSLVTAAGRDQLASACLPPAGRYAVDAGMRQVERLTAEMVPLRQPDRRHRSPPAGLPGAATALRHRTIARRGHLGRARRLPPVHQLRRRCPSRRLGRHGVVFGRQTHPRPSGQARTAGAALGVV